MRRTNLGWLTVWAGVLLATAGAGPTTGPATGPLTGPTTTRAVAHGARCDVWTGLPAEGDVTDLIADGALGRVPDRTETLAKLTVRSKEMPALAMAVRAILTAPRTGEYRFALAGDDSALLYLSSDESPDHRQLIAAVPMHADEFEYHWYDAQQSRGVALTAGRRYFIEAIVRNVDGACHVSVAWTMPGGPRESPVPAAYLEPAAGVVPPPAAVVTVRKLTLKPETPANLKTGFHRLVRGATVDLSGGDHFEMSYLLYLPGGFDAAKAATVPMLTFLHGSGHQGYDLFGATNEGPAEYLIDDEKLRAWFPMGLLVPQLPPGWRWDRPGAAAAVNALVEQVCQKYAAIDRHRLSLTGLSMGGKGTWLTALDGPDTYAAVATVSAVAVRPAVAKVKLANLPRLRMICGGDDGAFAEGTQLMYKALLPVLGDRERLTVCPHEGHGVWYHWYDDRAFYEDLMGARR